MTVNVSAMVHSVLIMFHFTNLITFQRISTYILSFGVAVTSEPVKPYFTRLLRVLTFCLGTSKIVIFAKMV